MGKSPTVRQKIAAKKSADAILLGRPVSKAKILKETGYSNKITRDPDRVFDTEGFRQALNEYLPLDRVSEVHKQLLENARDSVQMQAVKTTLTMPGTKGCSQALHNEKQPSHDGDFSSADLQTCLPVGRGSCHRKPAPTTLGKSFIATNQLVAGAPR